MYYDAIYISTARAERQIYITLFRIHSLQNIKIRSAGYIKGSAIARVVVAKRLRCELETSAAKRFA